MVCGKRSGKTWPPLCECTLLGDYDRYHHRIRGHSPNEQSEQILCVIGMLVGASTYAYVIGNVCGVMRSWTKPQQVQPADGRVNLYMARICPTIFVCDSRIFSVL